MPMIKDVKIPATKMQSRIQTATWILIYGGLLVLIAGYALARMTPASALEGWRTADTLMLSGSLATAIGALLIYIRSRMP